MDRKLFDQLLDASSRLTRIQIVALSGYGLWLLARRRAELAAFRSWLKLSWALFRRRTFIVVETPLPTARIIGSD